MESVRFSDVDYERLEVLAMAGNGAQADRFGLFIKTAGGGQKGENAFSLDCMLPFMVYPDQKVSVVGRLEVNWNRAALAALTKED